MKNEIMEITLISTGGTIEKKYDEIEGTLVNKESLVQNKVLDKLRTPYSNIHLRSILSKDSLNFTSEDRQLLLDTILDEFNKGRKVVVLHGTDTMSLSAHYIHDHLGGSKYPLIFTGAMKPLGFVDSDAFQNVTEALMAVTLLDPGVYISFHNKVFAVPGVEKNMEKRTFEEV
ncbi:MAG: asparaginase [Epsilonproteobacteria bacterium]|nr:MAG: asparaginase [Campylobacterota bacterium]RLA67648.1 MAG: asparaginase [Campylobacterota bacterium]